MNDTDSTKVNTDGSKEQFDTYIKKVAFYKACKVLDEFVRDFRRPDTVSLESLRDVADPFEFPATVSDGTKLGDTIISLGDPELAAGIATLKDNYKKVLELFILFDMPYEAIGELTKLGKDTAKTYKSRAMSILRDFLKEKDEEDEEDEKTEDGEDDKEDDEL